jgi:hypothetical protein
MPPRRCCRDPPPPRPPQPPPVTCDATKFKYYCQTDRQSSYCWLTADIAAKYSNIFDTTKIVDSPVCIGAMLDPSDNKCMVAKTSGDKGNPAGIYMACEEMIATSLELCCAESDAPPAGASSSPPPPPPAGAAP